MGWITLALSFALAVSTLVARSAATPPAVQDSPVGSLTVTDADREWWAFHGLERPPVPRGGERARNPIDRFWEAKLEEHGLAPAPPADPRVLVRRAHLVVTGLPPTPLAVQAHLTDARPDRWERLVDGLLASPHFGERWARHWLDVARFAESHGYEHDYDRPNAYHYRDFVVRAFNRDLPYDTFVRWQLAGDEFQPDDPQALAATGFLAAGTHATQITKNQVEKERYDELDDVLATTGTAMLGLSLGCARCHDHKYDPVPAADYYRMLSTFTTTVRSDLPVDFDPQGHARRQADFDAVHDLLLEARGRYERELLPSRFEHWLANGGWRDEVPQWIVLDDVDPHSEGGAQFTPLHDGSLLVSGPSADFDVYTLVAETRLSRITGLRLEALAHESLVRGGPGRGDNGNFALSDLQLTIAPLVGQTPPVTVPLRDPRSTFDQQGLGVAHTIDEDPRSCWAVDPRFGEDHAATFVFETPVGFEGGSRLTLTLDFHNNTRHAIGRPRISITTRAERPRPEAPSQAEHVLRALDRLEQGTPPAAETRDVLLAWFRSLDPGSIALEKAVQDHSAAAPQRDLRTVLVASEGVPAVRLHTQGVDFLEQTHFLGRGDPNQKLGVAPQAFLQVLSRAGPEHWIESPPAGSRTSWRRRSFAKWITDSELGAGHLLARVIVNRLWYHHFGRGIVATPSDFGAQGEPPTHPELLDWLACELIEGGWRLKPIHRLILGSATWRQSSSMATDGAGTARNFARDPQNIFGWRHRLRRVEAEVLRDSMLAVSGRLDPRLFGPGTLDETHVRRSLYFTVKRSALVPMLTIFDAPDALGSLATRATTTVAPQALVLMNDDQVRASALALADRLLTPGDEHHRRAVERAYRLTLSRVPTGEELEGSSAFVAQQAADYSAQGLADPVREALADLAQVLFASSEFAYIE
ncbi:MAG: DUF1549 and DUF1553 domain-containing protein [Planctomycetota bacterium]